VLAVSRALDEHDRQVLSALAVDETVDAEAGADALRRALHDAPTALSAAPPPDAPRSFASCSRAQWLPSATNGSRAASARRDDA
jgi:hypothetical protein